MISVQSYTENVQWMTYTTPKIIIRLHYKREDHYNIANWMWCVFGHKQPQPERP